MKVDNLSVKHDLQHQMLFIKLNGGVAFLKYERPRQNVLNFKETRVPAQFRHHGVASHLVKHGLEYARNENMYVIPTCSFVEDYVHRHPEYKDLKYSLE